ncbi:MAG: DUF2764 family protein [Bacteroidales bacterium]|nr:DUF2764 family protein [Bacteroidales bacterium]
MSNFEYIISSLPWLTVDFKYAEGQGFGQVIDEIKDNLGEKDCAVLDFLLKGFKANELNADFYAQALAHSVKFIREYFRFDLNLRNAKVRFLNQELGREAEQDVVTGIGGPEDEDLDIDLYRFSAGEFEEAAKVETALASGDLVSREKELDDVTWAKISALETFHYFDLTAVLAYVAKLNIVNRWLALDEEKGRELFHQLVREVRGTYTGVEFKDK